jgi:DNA-directed RNA polymerase subunit omega
MARLTVERCSNKFDHFELVAIASERAKQLISGAPPTVPKRNDKYPVVALREIEEDNIDGDKMRDIIISKYQLHGNHDNIDDEISESSEDSAIDVDYIPDEHNFDNMSITEFDNDIFSDDIVEDEDKII